MGDYTELNIGVKFKSDTPPGIIRAIDYMADPKPKRGSLGFPLDHELFKTERWDWMLNSKGSAYFDAQPTLIFKYDETGKNWCLTFCTNIKNYDNEWQKFLNFIEPHIETQGYIGTYRYENDINPTLLYYENGKIIWRKAEEVIKFVSKLQTIE